MSTFQDIFSDFLQAVRLYVEALVVTPQQFMRLLTQGVSNFQRETRMVETIATIVPATNPTTGGYAVPQDLMDIIELRDVSGFALVKHDYTQFRQIIERSSTASPTNIRSRSYYTEYGSGYGYGDTARIFTYYNRQIFVHPGMSDAQFQLFYVPNLQPISQNSAQWAAWYQFPLGTPNPAQFMTMFTTTSLQDALEPYEEGLLAYAIASFLKSQGSANYAVYEKQYLAEVERAKINKPVLFTHGQRPYRMAPWS